MRRFSSPVLALSRQQGETQQMVTSVNFASDCTPLEDLIICALHALMLYMNVVFISLSVLQLHRAAGFVSALLSSQILLLLFFTT